jgi:2-oxo-4-hydroxy-4-carboxy-5-ureidoimidazoline decarboxylase
VTVGELNALSPADAGTTFRACCGSGRWVHAMVAHRPYESPAAVFSASDSAWREATAEDWREAFAHHPRIGENAAEAPVDPRGRAWSAGEQSAVATVDDVTRTRLAIANREYEVRFGHIFLICATRKSAGDVLVELERRMANSPDRELAVAAEEQRKITRLRLGKLLDIDEGETA